MLCAIVFGLAVVVPSAWPPAFHGYAGNSFLFNPVMAMQQMLPHPRDSLTTTEIEHGFHK